MDVNAITCCAFNKAYKVLTDSKKGCLCDKDLYCAAMMQDQVEILITNQFDTGTIQKTRVCYNITFTNPQIIDPYPTDIYLTSIETESTTIDISSFVSYPIQNPLFIDQFVSGLQALGYDCGGATWQIDESVAGLLQVYYYGFDPFVSVTYTINGIEYSGNIPEIISCVPIPRFSCATAYYESEVISAIYLTSITIDSTTYDTSSLMINVGGSGSLSSLITFLQSNGYNLDNACSTGSSISLSNFTGGTPVSITVSGSIYTSQSLNYFVPNNNECCP